MSTTAETHLQTLNSVLSQLQSIRRFAPPLIGGKNATENMDAFGEVLVGKDVQAALEYAQGQKNDDEIAPKRKRRRISAVNGVSPAPIGNPSFLPPASKSVLSSPALTLKTLPSYINSRNQSAEVTYRLWKKDPRVVKVDGRDVFRAFVHLVERDGGELGIESVTFVGAGEKKLPHSHSDYTVYRRISQYFARVIDHHQSEVGIPVILDLISTYLDVFRKECTRCAQQLSTEGHLPPIGRVWTDEVGGGGGGWRARHMEHM